MTQNLLIGKEETHLIYEATNLLKVYLKSLQSVPSATLSPDLIITERSSFV